MAVDCAGESWWMVGLTVAVSRNPWKFAESSAALVFVTAFAVVAFCTWIIVHWLSPGGSAWGRVSRRSTIPGPKGWPVVGSLAAMGRRAHRNLAELAKSHGCRRLMAFSLGHTRVIMSSDPDVAREILNSSCFADRPIKESAYRLMFHRAIGFAPYSDYWRNLRKIAAGHLFAPKRIAAFEGSRQAVVDSMVNDIANASEGRGSVRVREIFQRASLNNVMRSVFGRSYDFGRGSEDRNARELADMVKEGYELLGAFNWADHLPLLEFLDLQGIRRRCSELVPKVYAFVQKIVDEHRAAPVGDKADADFVDVLLSLEGDQKLSDEDMIAVLWEMIFRGTDTVAILMEWILARMVLHPGIQAKARAELDRVVGPSRRVSESDIPNLPYVQAIVKEVLRMHPPGPLLSWSRLAIHDVHVGGHLVPAGTTAMVNMWSITHDPEVWADPGTFNPDRFIPSAGGEDVNIMGPDLKLAPFGSGRRVCPGKALGLATVHLWLARVLHHFEWMPTPDQPVDLSEVLRLSCEMEVPLSAKPIGRAVLPSQ